MSEMYCGTGSWKGPKPGDPDMTNINLWVTPAFGGNDVEWSYPGLNPEAVLHTILYRSTSPEVGTAVRHKIASGNFFYDKSTSATPIEYYYWIQMVSVNGTYGEMIGPRSATAKPAIADLIEQLSGEIDEGFLNQRLKQTIDQIELNRLNTQQAIEDLLAGDETLAITLDQVQQQTDDAVALLNAEVRVRTSADEALIASLNSMYAEVNGNIASLTQDQLLLANELDAIALFAQNIEAMVGTTSSQLQNEIDLRASQTAALGSSVSTLQADVAGNKSAIQTIQTTQASHDSSISSLSTTVQSTIPGQIASVKTGLETSIETLGGRVTNIGALYTAQVDVNGMVGGFGVYNNGTTVEAGFNVDRFWVGRATTKIKPFIIDGSQVFINEAVINKLTFDKLRAADGSLIVQNGKIKASYLEIGGDIQSTNFVTNSTGWRLQQNGNFEINGSVAGQGRLQMTNRAIKVFDGNGTLRVQLGDLNA